LKADKVNASPVSITVCLKPLSFVGAGWRLRERLAHFQPKSGAFRALVLHLRCLFFPATCYSFYEHTFHYRERSDLAAPPVAEGSASAWPDLHWLAVNERDKALALEKSDWVIFRDERDQWLQGGLEAIRDCCHKHPDAAVVSFDEQQVCEASSFSEPWLKPVWNLDFFLSGAYHGNSVALRGDLVSHFLPRLPSECFSSADALVDALLLAMLAHYRESFDYLVTHCPVLAMRVPKPVPAGDGDYQGPWWEARSEWLMSCFEAGVSTVFGAGRLGRVWQLHWPLPERSPLVSLSIPTRNGLAVLKPCLDAILQQTSYPDFEVLVVDNQSDCPATLEYLAALEAGDSRVRVLRYDQPFNFSSINNYAVARARGEVVGLVNNDIEPRHPEWLTEMVAQAVRTDIGCVGAKLYYPNGRIQHAGVVLGIGGVAGHAFRFEPGDAPGYQGRLALAQNYSAVTAACLLVRKSLYQEVGGLDERLAVNYNDVDFCLRVKALGYRNVWTPHAELTHYESFTRGGPANRQKRKRAEREFRLMGERWGELLDNDPAYHPKLTRVHEDFSLGASEWN